MCQGQLDPTPREADGTGNSDGGPQAPEHSMSVAAAHRLSCSGASGMSVP